ncbi:RrF2 family transcriptional regulator [Pseudaquabacterium rugosum]|jgi:Rrf2 family transcriptional regulator, nitric oxide-sensitive transcriptional repressor|uniref:Rrf2 family transcriptional regulator n=1 Tax=Pseudaquabacterium rugosum TaxID=2984194 RepID=A0ABU9B817_9BURK
MRLTAMTDYALRLLIYVGRQQPDRLCTIAEVALAHGLSETHLMKITHQLALAGWLQTVRGKGGGMRLARPADQINLGAVVRSIEPDFQLVDCLGDDDDACRLSGGCKLTGVFRSALQAFLAELDAHTLADVLPVSRAAWARVTLPVRERDGVR